MNKRCAAIEWTDEWYTEPLTDEQEDIAIAMVDNMSDEEFDEWYNNLINE